MNLPSLNALKFFEATARHLNMVKAAQELCVTHGAVSRQITQLESRLGVLLFVRRNRTIFLTAAGERLFATCQAVFAQLDETMAAITQSSELKPLVVSCEPTIAMRWLMARLPDFQALHPHIVVHLFAAGGAVSFAEKGIDLAIRRNDFASDCYVEKLADELMGPVCAPSLADVALTGAVRLHAQTRPMAWADWCVRTHHNESNLAGELQFEHFYLSLQAASAGLGVAMASKFMVEQDLAEGRLIAPFGFVEDGSSYSLMSETRFSEDLRKSVFLEWLRSCFADT